MNPNWDDRYREVAFAYGKAPNVFFKEQIDALPSGKLLMPADGEGRNGVYAATLGWEVTCFDLSIEGKNKALALAKEKEVAIQYEVGDFAVLSFAEETYDAIGLIYAHFPGDRLVAYYQRLSTYLKPGGTIILEGFSSNHLAYRAKNPKVGGPNAIEMLFTEEMIKTSFPQFDILKLEEVEVELSEGFFHQGVGSVIRFVGKKK